MSDSTERIDRPEPSEARTAAADTGVTSGSLLAEGQMLGGRYRIGRLLGRGGMGEVWQAFDLKLRVEVALKSVLHEAFSDQAALRLLRSEVRAARDVISPNVCRIFDLIEVEDQELVSMEYIDGVTLLDLLRERGPLEPREAGEVAAQFLAGLEAIHQADLVHRDVKPENLMITRSGRVVVMDFGVATRAGTGDISGTPAYMAPEQARGEAVDARADVFAAGMVLAEMLSAERGPDQSSRQTFWKALRREPPELPESVWRPILAQALSEDPDSRQKSASALARALEDVAFRIEGAEDKTPFPGLSAFGEDDAEFFFGREAEVEAVWKKLAQAQMLAVIGASGSGKSSFVRAGLLPASPEGWGHLTCQPGPAPFAALGRALSVQGDSQSALLGALARWRSGHDEALLVMDQFEELFTQSDEEVQASFAELLREIAIDCDVHVLLSMRDDFLLACQAHPPLAPIFSELTPLGAPTGGALRRALLQPALACGYRFEDEAMVEEMLSEVTKERGALPLIAFTAARLWEERDRETGYLTAEAYEAMGGVGGALAQHAEATLSGLDAAGKRIVRELFRNLVTARGTRASRQRSELLSVFDDQTVAGEVLQALVDARLLTAYEVQAGGDSPPVHRVEIIHESLLVAWPRLAGWMTQDADSARLRDELRRAARAWEERGRVDEMLWTGAPYREFLVWRENYPGGLTATEEAFASVMVEQAERRRRTRRIAIAAAFAVLLAIMAAIGGLWRRSELARREAILQAARSEASELLVLGRMELEGDPSEALAYSMASLLRHDTPAARHLAVAALSVAPSYLLTGSHATVAMDFSPDGRWLARGGILGVGRVEPPEKGFLSLLPRGGSPSVPLVAHEAPVVWVEFSPDGEVLASASLDGTVCFWSVAEAALMRSVQLGFGLFHFDTSGRELVFLQAASGELLVHRLSVENGDAELLGRVPYALDISLNALPDYDPVARLVAVPSDSEILLYSLDDLTARPRVLGGHEEEIRKVEFRDDGEMLVSVGAAGSIRVWSVASTSGSPALELVAGDLWGPQPTLPKLSADGRWLAIPQRGNGPTLLWDLEAPPLAGPLALSQSDETDGHVAAFDPSGEWLATGGSRGVAFWPVGRQYDVRLQAHEEVAGAALSADGQHLYTAGTGGLRRWPLAPGAAVAPELLVGPEEGRMMKVTWHPDGESLLFGTDTGVVGLVVPDGRPPRLLTGFEGGFLGSVAASPSGRLVAASAGLVSPEHALVRVWDLETEAARTLDAGDGKPIWSVKFVDETHVVSGGTSGLRLWDLEDGSVSLLDERSNWRTSISADHRELLVVPLSPSELEGRGGEPWIVELATGTSRQMPSRGSGVFNGALSPDGVTWVTSLTTGTVQIGRLDTDEYHLLVGHQSTIWAEISFSATGDRVITVDQLGEVRIWLVPEGRPFHSLPRDELIRRLSALTNLRVVREEGHETGYTLEIGPFAGWETMPSW